MAPDSWSNGEAALPPTAQQQQQQQQQQHLQQQPQASNHDPLDMQMIRHLLNRYTPEEITRLMQEETQSPMSHNDAASVLTSSTYSSVKSEDAPSVFDSGSSIRTFSDTSSRSSIISNVSARTAKFLGRKNQTVTATPSVHAEDSTWDTDDAATQSGDPASATTNAAKQKGAFMCGFCREESIQKTCTRKNDLKRHIEDFHNMNAQWFCRHRGCQAVFDWQTAYKTHLKHAHGGSRMSLDEAKVTLCQQTVFACGFENCLQVFEAPSDGEAGSTFKEYVGHVVKHFDEGANSGEWSYSSRIRNLLRQSGVLRAWTNSSLAEADRSRLMWHPQTSGILRKRLETRHIGDLQLLIHYAVALGSNPASIVKFREDFVSPMREQCQMAIQGHKIRAQPPPPPPSATAAAPEADPFSFKISRNSDPALAAYLASQRRVFVPRAPVRSGRSARPPMNSMPRSTPSQSPMPAQYSTFHNSPSASQIFDAQQLQQQQQQHHLQQQQQHHQHPQHQHMPQHHHTQHQPQQHQQHQQFNMMPQVNGGIVAEDLRSLRTMAGNTPEPDIEMGDTQMMESAYVTQPQHDFSGQYGAGGLQSPPPPDGCGTLSSPTGMDQHGLPFGAYDAQPHAY